MSDISSTNCEGDETTATATTRTLPFSEQKALFLLFSSVLSMPDESGAGDSSSASSTDQLDDSPQKNGGRRASGGVGGFSFRQQQRKRRSSTQSVTSNHESSHSSSEFSIHAITQKLASEDAEDNNDRVQKKIQKALKRQNFTLNQLNLDELELCGRDREFEILVEAFEASAAPSSPSSSISSRNVSSERSPGRSSCRVVNVTGRAGTGKTRLCLELKATVAARGGIFVTGKFDARSQKDPYSGFAVALAEIPDLVHALGSAASSKICTELREAVGEEFRLLTTLVPEFVRLFETSDPDRIDDKTPSTQVGNLEDRYETRFTRVSFLVLEVIRSVCSSGHPLVLFLDDMQWSDPSSLSLVAELVSVKDLSSFMVLTTCREEDMDASHPFLKQLDLFRQCSNVRLIPLNSLDVSAVHSIVSAALRCTDDSTSQLSKIVYQKSNGNPMYVIQFLNSLYEDGLLHFNLGLMRWNFDCSQVQSRFVTDNVVDLTTSKLKRFEPRVQTVLQLASCLGQTFDRVHLQALLEEPRIRSLFPFAIFSTKDGDESDITSDVGVLEREMVIETTSKLGRYSFVHDLIKEAAFQLIPESNRVQLQAEVGRRLLQYHQAAPLDDASYFRAIDMSNVDVSLLDDSEKLALAYHNFIAGEAAMSVGAFASALKFFEEGISCLGLDAWTTEPWLSLDLTNGAAEACYCTADFLTMETYISSVLNRDISVWDKIRVYKTRILAYAAQDRLVEAIDTGRRVLSEMGVTRLPRRPGLFHVLAEFVKTKHLMRIHDEQSLAALPHLDDIRLFLAMNIMDVMQIAAFLANPNLFIVMNLRMLRWTVTHGVCQFSPTLFASYGMVLCILGQTAAASSMGTIAMSLSERLDARSSRSKTINFVYSSCVVWTMSLRSCLKPLLRGYKVGMQTGEVELAMFNLSNYEHALLVTSAKPLRIVVNHLFSTAKRMKECNQDVARNLLLVTINFVLSLLVSGYPHLSAPQDLTLLAGEFDPVVLDEARAITEGSGSSGRTLFLEFSCLQIAYYFEDYERADRCSRLTADFPREVGGHFFVPRNTFFRCLTALALARQSVGLRRGSNLRRAARLTRQMERWSKAGNVDCVHMLQLLQAERASFSERNGLHTKRLYLAAINTASRNGYVNDKALCHERAFLFHLRHAERSEEDRFWAENHYKDAIQAYCDWNAFAKARHLVGRYGDRFPTARTALTEMSLIPESLEFSDNP